MWQKDDDSGKVHARFRLYYTAKELNELSYGNDARKCISRLRREGMDIQDLWKPDHRKLYWVPTEDNKQLSFWTCWEGVSYE